MKLDMPSMGGGCRWLAIALLAATTRNGRCLPTTEATARPTGIARTQAVRALDARTITPVWQDTGRPAASSRVTVRITGSPLAPNQCAEFEVMLRSNPIRPDGPDNDRAGANPDEVEVRAIELVQGGHVLRQYKSFQYWYEDAAQAKLPAAGRVLSAGSTREYTTGHEGPAYFQFRCLLQIPLSVIADEPRVAESRPGQYGTLQLRLTTYAGTLIVPLTRNVMTSEQVGTQPTRMISHTAAPADPSTLDDYWD
jgi:hypothetical protein